MLSETYANPGNLCNLSLARYRWEDIQTAHVIAESNVEIELALRMQNPFARIRDKAFFRMQAVVNELLEVEDTSFGPGFGELLDLLALRELRVQFSRLHLSREEAGT